MIGTLRYVRRQLAADTAHWRLTRKWRRFAHDHPLAHDMTGLLVREGIGDHFVVAAFAEALSHLHHCRIRLCGNPRYAFLRELFPAVAEYLPVPVHAEFDPVASRVIHPGEYSLAFFPADYSLARALGHGGFHMLDGYRCHLGLRGDVPPTIPLPPSQADLEDAANHLAAHNLPHGRTVLLCTDARSISTAAIPLDFWIRLAAELTRQGKAPVVNRGPTTVELPGVPFLDIPLERFRAVATTAGAICAVRSGLVDLVADLPALRAVLYPRISYGGSGLAEAFTLKRFGYQNAVSEFTVADDAFSHLPAILHAIS